MDWVRASRRILGVSLTVGVGGTLACSEPPREEEAVEQPTGNSASDTAGSSTGDQGVSSGSATSSTGGQGESTSDDDIKLDVGQQTTGNTTSDPDGEIGCKKVDFLFVIDNSGSMGDEQDNLISSFPGFIETIQTTLDEAQDYHIMVVDSDPWVYQGCQNACDTGCLDECLPDPPAQCILPCITALPCVFGDFQCGVTTPLDECETVLGAGVVHPRGSGASEQDCNFASGARYMDSSEPDLAATFSCAADVGVGSTAGTEKPMEAMVQAVTSGTPADACNEGFIRDDAILVVTFVTDEDDNNDSAGTVNGWRQALISAKGGDESAVVVLGLFGDTEQANPVCEPPANEDDTDGAEDSENLRNFVESWGPQGVAGSVCADSYNEFFQSAVDIIDTTCEDFTPPEG